MTPDGSYHLVLRQPIGPSGDLVGRKIRGTPSYFGVFRLLNASPVSMPPGEVYTSLDKGVIEGTTWPVIGALGYRWYEVAKYMMRPAFGFTLTPILVNLNTWNRLSEAERRILLDEGPQGGRRLVQGISPARRRRRKGAARQGHVAHTDGPRATGKTQGRLGRRAVGNITQEREAPDRPQAVAAVRAPEASARLVQARPSQTRRFGLTETHFSRADRNENSGGPLRLRAVVFA